MARKLSREWMDDDGRQEAHRRKRRNVAIQEKRTAAAHPGGALTKGSGCSQHANRKSDSVGDYFRAENKTTETKTLPLRHADLRKIQHEAEQTGRRPMLVLGFNAIPGDPDRRVRDDWAAFPQNTASYMMRACAKLLEGDIAEARVLAEMALGSPA